MESTTDILESALRRLKDGEADARDELISLASDRMLDLARRMFRSFPRLRAWEQTDDVWQNASMRLRRSLSSVAPENVREFYGLAAQQIRRELLDMTRAHFGRARKPGSPHEGDGRKATARPTLHVGGPKKRDGATDSTAPGPDGVDDTADPEKLAAWQEFHQHVAALSDPLREVVDLLWYHEVTHDEAARLLNVDPTTVRRRWRAARRLLRQALKDWLPSHQAD